MLNTKFRFIAIFNWLSYISGFLFKISIIHNKNFDIWTEKSNFLCQIFGAGCLI